MVWWTDQCGAWWCVCEVGVCYVLLYSVIMVLVFSKNNGFANA